MQWKLLVPALAALAAPLAGLAANVSTEPAPKAERAAARTFPTKPIRLIDPFAPGGGTDFVARLIGPKLTKIWGQTVVIDNRAGASGAIGSEIAARSVPDGYTLLMATASTIVINPLLTKVPFDPIRDFAPVVQAVSLMIKTGVKVVDITYKGGGAVTVGLLSGEVQMDFSNILSVLPHVKAGKVRALAVTGLRRSAAVPDLPTVAEGGVPGFDVQNWNGVLALAGTPRNVIAKLNHDIAGVLRMPDVQDRLISSGADIGGGTPQDFANHIRAETAKWGEVIRNAATRPDR